ncbi:MAG: TIGR02147 family protein [Bdellovibrionales bacterium]
MLNEELISRTERNSRYSVRSFARSLNLDSGALSQILSGKRIPSVKVAAKLIERLGLSPDEKATFLSSLAEIHCNRKLQRTRKFFKDISTEIKSVTGRVQYRDLSLDLFRTIADWHHYAILELTFVDGFSSNPRWIAAELGISISEANLAIARLKELGFLSDEDGELKKSTPPLLTSDRTLTTSAHKKRQKQILAKAIEAIDEVPLEFRNHSAMTMAIDPKKIPEAKKKIQTFLDDLSVFLESGKKTQVYEASVCLFPIQKNRKGYS